MKHKITRRAISLLLVLVMLMGIPLSALATDTDSSEVASQVESSVEESASESESESEAPPEISSEEPGDSEEVEETEIEDPADSPEELEEPSEDTETPEPEPELPELDVDLTNGRILVEANNQTVIDDDAVVAEHDGIYLLQYDTVEQAEDAYRQYAETAESVEADIEFGLADEDETPVSTDDIMTEEENPFTAMEEEISSADPVKQKNVIAVIDTGATLSDNVIAVHSVLGDDGSDKSGHGTNVINAIIGENPDAEIISIKAFDDKGKGSTSSVYAAIVLAMELNVDYINLSAYGKTNDESSVLSSAIQDAVKNGIVFVGAAGNDGQDVKDYIPGNIAEAVIVGASDSNGSPLASSNYGETVDYWINASSTSIATAIVTGRLSAGLDPEIGRVEEAEPSPTPTAEPEPSAEPTPEVSPEPEQDAAEHNVKYEYITVDDTFPADGDLSSFDSYPDSHIFTIHDSGLATKAEDEYVVPLLESEYFNIVPYVNNSKVNDIVANENGEIEIPASYFDGEEDPEILIVVFDRQKTQYTYTAKITVETTMDGLTGYIPESTIETTGYDVEIPVMEKDHAGDIKLDNIYVYVNQKSVKLDGASYNQTTGILFVPYTSVLPADIEIVIGESGNDDMQVAASSIVTGSTTTLSYVDYLPHAGAFCYGVDDTIREYDGQSYEGLLYCIDPGSDTGPNMSKMYVSTWDDNYGEYLSQKNGGIVALLYILANGYRNAGDESLVLDVGSLTNLPSGVRWRVTETYEGVVNTYKFEGLELDLLTQCALWTFIMQGGVKTDIGTYGGGVALRAYGNGKSADEFMTYFAFGGAALYYKALDYVAKGGGITEEMQWIMDRIYFLSATDNRNYTGGGYYQTMMAIPVGEAASYGSLQLEKSSSNPAMTNKNSCYSFVGTTYGVYKDENCSDDSKVGELVVSSGTKSNVLENLPAGKYYYKELKAGKGYKLDTRVHEVKVTANETIKIDATDEPDNDPIVVRIDKQNADAGSSGTPLSMAGAEFSVTWYSGLFTSESSAESAVSAGTANKRTWTITTSAETQNGKTIYMADMSSAKGDPFFTNSVGDKVIPHGTLIIKESKSPTGYLLDPTYSVSGGTATADAAIFQIDGSDNIFRYLKTGNSMDEINMTVYEKQISGGVTITKKDRPSDSTTPEGDASLKGTVFTIYNNSGYTIYIDGTAYKDGDAVTTITTNASGVAQTGKNALPYGSYTIKETDAPTGYTVSTTSKSFSIKQDGVIVDAGDIKDTPQTGKGAVKKVDSNSAENAPQGDATLKGAEFTIYNKSANAVYVNGVSYAPNAKIMTITTDENGNAATAAKVLPYGTYSIEETKAPTGYLTAAAQTFTIRSDGQTQTVTFSDVIIRGGIKLTKTDVDSKSSTPQGDGSLAGAEFTIYNKSAAKVYVNGKWYEPDAKIMTITTNASGYATTGEKVLPYGTYLVSETKTPTGYLKVADTTVTIRSDGQMVDISSKAIETPMRGSVVIDKTDFNSSTTTPQGDASLQGAEFTIYNKSAQAIYYNGTKVAVNGVVTVLTTDKNGHAETPAKSLPYGTYLISETKAPAGYLAVVDRTFTIRSDGQVVDYSINKDQPMAEIVYRGGIELTKRDYDTSKNVPQGDATLAGAEFTVYNNSAKSIYYQAERKWIKPGEAVMVITTNAQGYATTGNNVLPYGTYSVKETKAPVGYTLDGDIEITNIQVRENGKMYTYDDSIKDTVWRGGLKIQKRDIETKKTTPLGGATLESVEFEIYNASKESVYVDGKLVAVGGLVKTIVTDADGIAKTDADSLPYGTYRVIESTAPNGYLGTDMGYTVEVKDTTVGKDGYYDMTGESNSFYNQVKRGDIELRKINSENQKTMAGVTFRITAYDKDGNEIETHDVLTDLNGEFTSQAFPHSQDTNGGNMESGLWFGVDAPVNDNLGALPYGRYKIEEIEGENNQGKVMFEDEFYVYRDNQVIHLNNIENADELVPEIGTNLHRKGDEDAHYVMAQKNMTLVDTIYYEDFDNYKGQMVTFTGTLMNADTGKEITDADGNPITASITKKVRTAGEVNVTFKFDGSELVGVTVVAFETATVEVDGKETVIAEHKDLKDVDQTVYVPEIKTTATDAATGNHLSNAKGTVTIVDTVDYKNLEPGEEYTMEAKLVDKATGDAITDKDGRDVTAIVVFTAEKSSGTVEVTFEFEAGDDLAGKTAVAFEEIPNYATHADLNDEDQTIYFPEVGTTAINAETSTQYVEASGTATVTDTVEYHNLIVGKRYRVSGHPVDRDSGEIIESVTGEARFTAEDTDGTIDVAFEFDAEQLAGKTLVFFEQLYVVIDDDDNDVEVGSHEDPEDEPQTIAIPDGGTTLVDGETKDHVGKAREDIVLVDTVEYKGLIPGREYTVYGQLMDKSTGEAYLVEGEQVWASNTFTPTKSSGQVNVTFTFDGSNLAGTTLVAFEAVYDGDLEVFVHADIDDDDQTVYIPDGQTEAKDARTETHTALAEEKTTIIDTVTYTNLLPGVEYTMRGVLMDKATDEPIKVDGEEVTAEAKFTPDSPDGSVEITFELDSSALAGKTVVAFESCEYEGIEVFVHADITDENQTVHFPRIRTSVRDSETEDHISLADNEITLIDTVSYTNLLPGQYKISGYLMDKNTGEPLLVNGEKVTGETTLVIEEGTDGESTAIGTVDVTFVFDASALQDSVLVVFERLALDTETEGPDDSEEPDDSEDKDTTTVAIHEDIDDVSQTVTLPGGETTALADDTNEHITMADDSVTITDTITYRGLLVGKEYTATGILMDKATGEAITVDGEYIYNSVTFTAEEADGTIEVPFTFDGSALAGTTVVVFEAVYYNGKQVFVHADINDDDQSVNIPDGYTEAKDAKTETHNTMAEEKQTILDTVYYTNLRPGLEYTITGILMDKSTGEPLMVGGDTVTASETFTPKTADGSVVITFELDASALAGKTLVAFETCSYEGVDVFVHADIEDEDQTIYIPNIGTTLTDASNNLHYTKASAETTLVDTVMFENLIPGQTYKVTGYLIDKQTEETLEGVTGGETTFTADAASGTVNVEFKLDTSKLGGYSLVAFEQLYVVKADKTEEIVARHEDPDDDSQTVNVPGGRTTLLDSKTQEHVAYAEDKVTLIDTVTYVGLYPNYEYTVTGVLMDKETGKALLVDGKEVQASASFTPEDYSGTVDVAFTFDGSALAKKTVVAFESVYYKDIEIFVHADINDEGQSVNFPDGKTSAKDAKTETNTTLAEEQVKIIDTVTYTNLKPGLEYKVTGVLMDKATGEPLLVKDKKVTGETIFTPTEANGTVEVVFELDGSALAGKTLVAFEECTYNDKTVFTHADIEDADQTIYIPSMKTSAKDGKNNNHTGTISEKVTIIDTVNYTNLIPGKEYTLKGTLMVKGTGKPVVVEGKPVAVEKTFKPEKADGSVEMTFELNTTALGGQIVVVFEKLYDGTHLIASHEDINDNDQSIIYPKTTTPTTKTPTTTTKTISTTKDKDSAKTGDTNVLWVWIVIAILAGGGIGVAAYKLKKSKSSKGPNA